MPSLVRGTLTIPGTRRASLRDPSGWSANAEALLAQRTRVLIIDDNRLMREGLSALLKAQPDLQVVGAVADLAAALRQVPEVTPHIVLVDAGLGSCDGARCVEQIRQSAPAARVIVRSEEHTSELQSPCNLVCRLLLEKKKNQPHI